METSPQTFGDDDQCKDEFETVLDYALKKFISINNLLLWTDPSKVETFLNKSPILSSRSFWSIFGRFLFDIDFVVEDLIRTDYITITFEPIFLQLALND